MTSPRDPEDQIDMTSEERNDVRGDEEPPESRAVPAADPIDAIHLPSVVDGTPDGNLSAEKEMLPSKSSQDVGIVGGKASGKSYLINAIVYRTTSGARAGSLSPYLHRDAVRLFMSRDGEPESAVNLARFIEQYASWERLGQTLLMDQRWFRLQLQYRAGFLGQQRKEMSVVLLDGSGEGFFSALGNSAKQMWRKGYMEARLMIFCLPLWVAFPGPLTEDDRQFREQMLEEFEQVVSNYLTLREEQGLSHPVRTVLALTMADDRKGALETLRDRWINPIMDSPDFYLRKFRTSAGSARYLANARRVSDILFDEFMSANGPLVSRIPGMIDFGAGRPWLVPMSSIDGAMLDYVESATPADGHRLPPPVPVHVELPLLVALCQKTNALM